MNRYFTKRKAKKSPAQPKFELDLTSALPSSDNFRTSLMMDSLSKRFSMLREQDDPYSKLGKASDDSVLAPRRQSRLVDFGYTPGRTLHDIAEVSSISSSIRPPFAASNRADSFASESGYPTDDESSVNGSMMNRARPGEGNILFGGRQKIYKIPMAGPASESALNISSSGEKAPATSPPAAGMKGRALYDDDVSTSTFQRWRQEERERLAREKGQRGRPSIDGDSPTKTSPHSPSLPTSVTRHASTSTTSAPSVGRTSTAATSIASQAGAIAPISALSSPNPNHSAFSASPAFDRNNTKSRRLYDQVLHKEIEEQQSSAITRLNSLQKNKGGSSPTFGRSGSRQGAYPNTSLQTPPISPPIQNPLSHSSFPLLENTIPEHSPVEDRSPVNGFSRHPLMSAISPNDRGKATAMGAFNKPQQFNEKQYLERQLTLRRNQESNTAEDLQKHDSAKISMDADRSDNQSLYAQSSVSGRSRAATNASQDAVPSAFSVFQHAASQMKTAPVLPEIKDTDENKTNFFFARSSSGSEDDHERDIQSSFRLPPMSSIMAANSTQTSQPPKHEHPAFRSRNVPEPDHSKPLSTQSRQLSVADSPSDRDSFPTPSLPKLDETAASENTLGLANGGLSGLVRQHLRQNSGGSSLYGDEDTRSIYSPTHPPNYLGMRPHEPLPPAPLKTSYSGAFSSTNYGNSHPFDSDDVKQRTHADNSFFNPISPVEEPSQTTEDNEPKNIRASRRRGFSRAPETTDDIPWQSENQKSHGRGPSSDTIQEQDAFSSEIAKRQRALQERLRAKLDEVPAAAPAQEERFLPGPFRGLDILRTKSSRESMKKPNESPIPPKASKVFGLGPTSINPITERPSFQSDRWRSEEASYSSSIRSRSNSRPATSRSAAPTKQYNMANGSDSGRTSDDYPPTSRDRKGSNPPPISALNQNNRSRSNSNQSNGRSRSRNGRYRDDLDKAMAEGTSSRVTTQIYTEPPTIPENAPTPPLPNFDNMHRYGPDSNPSPALKIQTGRHPASSNGYFESKGLYPPPSVQSPMSASSTTSSPRLPMPHHSVLSPGMSPRPSPGFGPASPMGQARNSPIPFPNVATPPLSGASTPVSHSFNSGPPPVSSNRARSQSRKRSIQKSDIGEPRLISTTSVIDTVELPPGASLRNGMDEIQNPAPPVPPINPLRRKFGFGRPSEENIREYSAPYQQTASNGYYANDDTTTFKPRHRLRKSSSEGEKLGMRLRGQPQVNVSNPTLAGRNNMRPPMEGGMF